MLDLYNRNIDYVRLSVTDKCNFKCVYCMSENECMYKEKNILSFDDYEKILNVLYKLGIKKIKITGGEPLIRPGIIDFIRSLKKDFRFDSVTITTNGYYLDKYWKDLVNMRIDGINISIDSLREDRYNKITRGGDLFKVLKSINNLLDYGYKNLKINTVLIKGVNDDEINDFAQMAKKNKIAVRFIELMPIGPARGYKGLSREEIVKQLEIVNGVYNPLSYRGNGPAEYISFNGFLGKIGFIDAVNHKFCSECNRIRLDSLGNFIMCLHHQEGISSKKFLNGEISEKEFLEKISASIKNKAKENNFIDDPKLLPSINKIGG
ncbi:MAG: GTP 3',8-cyclase MoaA [Peptoniphilaceae bacterium]